MTRSSDAQPNDPFQPPANRWARFRTDWLARVRPGAWLGWIGRGFRPHRVHRLLFLDDDPNRAAVFLENHPQAVWVTTVPDCLTRLAEPWDEVHLDHDLGGRRYVNSADSDCGMEVIRWLCKEPRVHLKGSLFFVHTHNATAGLLMVLLMRCGGYNAEFRPFGLDLKELLAHNEPETLLEEEGFFKHPARLAKRAHLFWKAWVTRLRRTDHVGGRH